MIRFLRNPIAWIDEDYGRSFCLSFLICTIGWVFGFFFWITNVLTVAYALGLITILGLLFFMLTTALFVRREAEKARKAKEKIRQKMADAKLSTGK